MAGSAATAMVMVSRVLESYAAEWLIGAFAAGFLMLRGSNLERGVIVLLLLISLILGGEQLQFGVRQTMFIAMFMLFARYIVVAPLIALALYLLGMVGYRLVQGEISALFVLVPTLVPLLIAADLQRRARTRSDGSAGWKIGALSGAALVFPFVGSGSRTAFFAWIVFALRRITVPMAIVMALGAAVILSIPGLEMAQKLGQSISELTTPVAEEGGGVSQRALEGLVFLTWLPTATPLEWLIGSNEAIHLPGDLLNNSNDPPFIPHNQFFGLFFQFGVLGLLAIAAYMRGVWRHMSPFPEARLLFFALLLPGFITSGGFITPDYAVLAGAINGLLHRRGTSPG